MHAEGQSRGLLASCNIRPGLELGCPGVEASASVCPSGRNQPETVRATWELDLPVSEGITEAGGGGWREGLTRLGWTCNLVPDLRGCPERA